MKKRIQIYRKTRWNELPVDSHRCAANVGDIYGSSQCLREGKYERMGYMYCSQHAKMIDQARTQPEPEGGE